MITEKLLMMLLETEQSALKDDDPSSTCAAHHRGAISAYLGLLNRMNSSRSEEYYDKQIIEYRALKDGLATVLAELNRLVNKNETEGEKSQISQLNNSLTR